MIAALYAEDFRGRIPPALSGTPGQPDYRAWYDIILDFGYDGKTGYVGRNAEGNGIFYCPTSSELLRQISLSHWRARGTYTFNIWVGWVGNGVLADIRPPASRMLYAEISDVQHAVGQHYYMGNRDGLGFWHLDRANAVFADGHVQSMAFGEVTYPTAAPNPSNYQQFPW